MVEEVEKRNRLTHIPSPAALTEIYEERYKVIIKKRLQVIEEWTANKLMRTAEEGNNFLLIWENSTPGMTMTYEEICWLKKKLKEEGYKVKLKYSDGWSSAWYLDVSWGKNIALRELL